MTDKLYRYFVEMRHDPGISRLGNEAYRKVFQEASILLNKLMLERSIKMIELYHLDPEHRVYAIMEAYRIEDIRDVLYESKTMHTCEAHIYPVTVMDENTWFDNGPEPGVNPVGE